MKVISDYRANQAAVKFERMLLPVTLALLPGEEETTVAMKSLLEELLQLSNLLQVTVYDPDTNIAAELGITETPTFILLDKDGRDQGVRFLGLPTGLELDVLIDDIVTVGQGVTSLSPMARQDLLRLNTPLKVDIFTTPSCPKCAQSARLIHQMAIENPLLKARLIDITAYPFFASRYDIKTVPYFVINESVGFAGPLPEAVILQRILQEALI